MNEAVGGGVYQQRRERKEVTSVNKGSYFPGSRFFVVAHPSGQIIRAVGWSCEDSTGDEPLR